MQRFLELLFGGKLQNDFILIWEKNGLKSNWFQDISKAVTFMSQGVTGDIYVGVGCSPKDYGPKNRCDATNISGIGGVWLDLDIKDPVHKKSNLPASEEDINAILACLPLKPTMSIHSGHGRQYWWVFKDFWSFKTEEDRLKGAKFVQRVNYLFRDHARALGFGVDSTFDLSRIMRIPGTMNFKTDPVPVTMLDCDSNRLYKPEDIESFLPPVATQPTMPAIESVIQFDDIIIDPNAEPPKLKFHALCCAEKNFELSFAKKRSDFKERGDDTGNVYDLSLASFAFRAGWTPQEIVDLIICFRRTHNLTQRLNPSYYRLTLTKASSEIRRKEAQEHVEAVAMNIDPKPDPNATEKDRKRAILNNLSIMLSIRILKIVKFDKSPPEYRIYTDKGEISLGRAAGITNQIAFRNAIADATNELIPLFGKERWQQLAKNIFLAVETDTCGADSTELGSLEVWLEDYFFLKPPIYDKVEAWITKRPFFSDGRLFVLSSNFQDWIREQKKNPMNYSVPIVMKNFGFTDAKTDFKSKKGAETQVNTSAVVWSVPITHRFATRYFDRDIYDAIQEENRLELLESREARRKR